MCVRGDVASRLQDLAWAIEGVERAYFDGNPPRLMVDLESPHGGSQALELAQLSDGYRNLLALFLDFARRLAQANPTWPKPLEAPGMLLIDEIELHLHPRWQQTVIPSLRAAFPNTQLIIATHSPAVLPTVRREHIRILTADHQLGALSGDVGTCGAENERVLAEVFGTHSRPPGIETTTKLNRYLDLVEDRQQGSEEGLALRAELENALGKRSRSAARGYAGPADRGPGEENPDTRMGRCGREYGGVQRYRIVVTYC